MLLKSKKKIGGNHAFFENNILLINNICKKLLNTKQCMAFFSKLKLNYFWKMRGYPQFTPYDSLVVGIVHFLGQFRG